MCTGLTCFVVILPAIAVEGVVVLKEVVSCAAGCTMIIVFFVSMGMVLELYCPSYGSGVVQCALSKTVGTVRGW